MGPFGVIMFHPLFGEHPDLGQGFEQECIEHLLAIASVESFDKAVLHGLAGLDVLDFDVVCPAPQLEVGRGELRAVVDPYHVRPAPEGHQSVQFPYQPLRAYGDICHVPKCLPVEIVDDVQDPESLSVGQAVVHEVHAPDNVRANR